MLAQRKLTLGFRSRRKSNEEKTVAESALEDAQDFVLHLVLHPWRMRKHNMLAETLRKLKVRCSRRRLRRLCRFMDADGDGNVTFDEFLVALDIEVPDALKYDSSSVLRGTQTRPTADERRRSTGPKGKTAEDIEASYADSCAC